MWVSKIIFISMCFKNANTIWAPKHQYTYTNSNAKFCHIHLYTRSWHTNTWHHHFYDHSDLHANNYTNWFWQ